MICYQELYGCDADGNRGQVITWADLEPSDDDDIREEIINQYEPGKVDYTVTLYCHQYDTEHEFEVSVFDYFTKYELEELDNDT